MPNLRFIATHVAPKASYSENITDMTLVETGQGTVLVALSINGMVLTDYALTNADTAARFIQQSAPKTYGTYFGTPQLDVVQGPDNSYHIAVTGRQDSVYSSLLMAGDGSFNGYGTLFQKGQIAGDIVALDAFGIGDQDYLLAGRNGSLALQLYRMGADLSLVGLGSAAPGRRVATGSEYSDIELHGLGGRTFAFATSARGNLLGVYEVASGGLATKIVIDGSNQIGISAPREVAAMATANGHFLVVSGGESDSLTVFRIASSGGLGLRDHVVDSTTTRFQAVTAMATVEMGGRAYIFVGGADDGISVLTLDGEGRLHLLAVLADTDAMALANVSAIEAKQVGGKIALFVASATEAGISQLSFDPGPIGKSLVGTGSLIGGALDDILVGTGASSALAGGEGDDILIARSGTVSLKGDAGRDTFVPGFDTRMVTILDFDPARDRLDLSELAYIRSLAQLQILPSAKGALLVGGEVRIEIRTVGGTSMKASDFKEEMFRLAHYANDIDYTALLTPVTPDPGDPSVSAPPTGSSGGYTGPAPLPPMLVFSSQVLGTSGPDRMVAGASSAQLRGLEGNDRIYGAANARCNLIGGPGRDWIQGGKQADFIEGGAGQDTIIGGPGHDRLMGGDDADQIFGGDGADRIHGGDGRNILIGHEGNDVITASGNGGNIMRGDGGSDLIRGAGGADTIIGGPGHDRLYAGGNNNRIAGQDGNDLIQGKGFSSVLVGGQGNDTVYGGAGHDYLYGDNGDDLIAGRGDDDFLIGHAGNDTMFGDDGDDHVIGMIGNDEIRGGNGNDMLWGVEGNDLIIGAAGKDSLRGGDGRDSLHGGDGDDLLIGGAGGDVLSGDDGADFVLAQEGNDSVHGGDGNDRLFGMTGRDLIYGGTGDDLVAGNDDSDVLYGGAGHDDLAGGQGNDTLYGDQGNDTLTGSQGEDVFIFGAPGAATVETDTITDFQRDLDVIDLSHVSPGLVWMGTEAFTDSGRAEVRIVQYSSKTRIQIDSDGDGAVELNIDVLGSNIGPFDLLY